MSREESVLSVVTATVRFQEEIADMLDAKATEIEKARAWIINNVYSHSFEDQAERMKQAMGIHEQMIEVIDGLTKLENALGTHLKLLIGQEESGADASGFGGMGGSLSGGIGGLFGGLGAK